MADPVEKAKEVVHAVEHPVDAAKALEREAEEGRSARTPVIALTGVTLFGGCSAPVPAPSVIGPS